LKKLAYGILTTVLLIGSAFAAEATKGASTASAQKPAQKAAKKEESMSNNYTDKVADIKTNKGTITIRLFPEVAPNHVKNFIDLAEKGFYNGTKFHRVIPGFMIQGGDPNTISGSPSTWGTGGSGKHLKAEFNKTHHARGIVSMARAGDPDSASSQFFICVADAGYLDKQYSAFGEVTKGMDVADAIANTPRDANDRPKSPVIVESITIRSATAAEKGALKA
jgi:peptidyl-prolyl cis-trans isomerase B (cyclophilin B)